MQDRIEALLAQVGFWAGRRVGRTHAQIRWIVFKLYVDFRKGTGYTEMQIARELNMSVTELRAMYYRITVTEVRKALGITEHEIGSNPN